MLIIKHPAEGRELIIEETTLDAIGAACNLLFYTRPDLSSMERNVEFIFSERSLKEFYSLFENEFNHYFIKKDYEESEFGTVFTSVINYPQQYISIFLPMIGIVNNIPNIYRYTLRKELLNQK